MFSATDLQFQLLTFVLELSGLSLAFIEVRMPATAERLARVLSRLAAPVEELRHREGHGGTNESLLASSLGGFLHRVLTLGSLPVFALFFFNVGDQWLASGFSAEWFVPTLIGLAISLIVVMTLLTLLSLLLYFAVVGGSDFATRFVEGRAVGTLGLLVASAGLLLESYQLLTLG